MASYPNLVYQRKLVGNVREALVKSTMSNTVKMQIKPPTPISTTCSTDTLLVLQCLPCQ